VAKNKQGRPKNILSIECCKGFNGGTIPYRVGKTREMGDWGAAKNPEEMNRPTVADRKASEGEPGWKE